MNISKEIITTVFFSSLIIIYLIRMLIQKSFKINQMKNMLTILKKEQEEAIKIAEFEARKDSKDRQRSILKGQISETIAPWSMGTVNSVKELNFIGNPIDFIGFKGLDGEGEIEIKFIEVKDGKSQLNKNQRRVRDAVKEKRIEWVEVRIKKIEIEEKVIT
jgi:predicted Holliday junction resolvase-like endonuclease